jgi:cytochrome c peroxidase
MMRVPALGLALVLALGAGAACGEPAPADPDAAAPDAPPDAAPGGWPFALPLGFPTPRLPADQRLTPELAELGRHLFYDKRLSGNGTQACASCHEQARAFTDGRVTPQGSTGTVLKRNAMSLTNIAYNPTQTWANHILVTLEQQAPVPMFGTDPIELGITGNEDVVLGRLRGDPRYQALYAAAYPGATEPLGLGHVVAALAAFERRLISGNSPLDKHRRGELVLPDDALRGEALFFSERLECHHCHGGFNFTIAVDHRALAEPGIAFFNTGLYNVGGTGAYPAGDQGLRDVTFLDEDRGRFRPPTLRNIAVTAPYMHEGSMATLDEVLRFYERGGRDIPSGPDAGDGRLSPYKSSFVAGFTLTDQERADLIAFLTALTDETFLADPALADPFAP